MCADGKSRNTLLTATTNFLQRKREPFNPLTIETTVKSLPATTSEILYGGNHSLEHYRMVFERRDRHKHIRN